MFITRFATKEDWWISEYRYKPEVTIYGRFYRQHGEDDDGMIILDERGWSELVGNVVKMTIIFTSLKFTVTAYVLAPLCFALRLSYWQAIPKTMTAIQSTGLASQGWTIDNITTGRRWTNELNKVGRNLQ